MISLDKRVLHERMQRTSQKLIENNCSALVLYAPGSALGNATQAHGYMRYLCDWDGYNNVSVLVLFPKEKPVLFVTNIFLHSLAQAQSCIEDVRFAPLPALSQAVAECISTQETNTKLAYIGRAETPVPFWEGLLTNSETVDVVSFEALLDVERVVKDALQITIHMRAAEICDAMFEELYRQIPMGKPVYQIQADLERIARYAGAEFVQTWLTVGPAADYCRFRYAECQRVPQQGDQVLLGIYLFYKGHWGHAIRMGSYGQESKEHRRAFDIVLEMQEAGIKALVPEKNLYDVQKAFKEVFARHFSKEEQKNIFQFRAAHGLGHSYEDPITSVPFPQDYLPSVQKADSFMEIVPGMLFELHPNFFLKNVAGGALGDMAYITDKGAVLLNQFPREFIYWGK